MLCRCNTHLGDDRVAVTNDSILRLPGILRDVELEEALDGLKVIVSE
jgi:hypothetical protein